jgi:hypothetical protein
VPPPALAHLCDKPIWVAWAYVWKAKAGKWDKPPINPHTGKMAKVNDPQTWGSFDEALAAVKRYKLAGVGLMLVKDGGVTGVDLDDCITDADGFTPLVAEVLDYNETYAECSPSGKGLRLFVRGATTDGIGVEVYDHGRYLTVTGQHWEGSPSEIREAPLTLARLTAAVDAEREKKRETKKPAKPNRGHVNGHANGRAHAGGDDFFRNVNAAALANLDKWVPALHPTAEKQATGGWSISSEAFRRDLQERLSYHHSGITDFGEERGLTPIDAVLKYGDAADAKAAAIWLCRRLSVEPASLGWEGRAQGSATAVQSTEIQGDFLLVRGWTDGRRPGVYFNEAKPTNDDPNPKPEWRWFCSRIEPLAKTRGNDNRNWGRLLEVIDSDGVPHVWAMPARVGPTVGDGTDFRRELVDRGLEIASGGKARNRLSDYITIWKPSRKVRCVSTVGWSGDAFVMPHCQFGGEEEIVLQVEGVAPEFTSAGNLDDWRRDIAARCVGNSRLMFGVSAAFTGPLLRLAGEESGGVHFCGSSSIGKTTTLHVARSVWGMPLGSWRTTDNSAEAIAAGALC